MKFGFLRKDDDGHDYLIPEEIIKEFDSKLEELEKAWNYEGIIAHYNNHRNYAIGGSPYDLKVVIPE